MQRRSLAQVRRWLDTQPSLADVRRPYPAEWASVQRELAGVLAQGSVDAVTAYAAAVARPPTPADARASPDAQVAAAVHQYLAAAAMRRMCLTAATGRREGRVRFNLLNGFVAQRLLFAHALERKPVALRRFRLLWPLVWQRRYLMPLVEPQGIYCFYSRPLVDRLAARIGGRRALEIAAGDGTLSRFLTAAGADITATDDGSWAASIGYPDSVVRRDARTALRWHAPEVVLCSWPPAGNTFERCVFSTATVQTYIVISSRHEFAAGNWADYHDQQAFAFAEDPRLSRLVLPPELDAAVYVFERRSA